MKTFINFAFLFLPIFSFAQVNTLNDQLWTRVMTCYDMFEDSNEDGLPDFDKIDDAKNGYLKISGTWPTCGCSCNSTVGAYKNKKGTYTMLQSDGVTCSWERKISSDRNLIDVLPAGFGLENFSNQDLNSEILAPAFFFNFDIPRYGTETKVSIELVPFGLTPDGEDIHCFEYKEDTENGNVISLLSIRDIAEQIKNEKTLDYILSGEFDKILDVDMIAIERTFDENFFTSIEDIREHLWTLKKIYNIYNKLEYTELTLDWNIENSRFYIKSKGKKAVKMSFRQFLKDGLYWNPIC
jgi:hypothetical protein